MPDSPDASRDNPPQQAAASGTARPTLGFFLVVDCSGSMAGERIASLNYAVRAAIPAMRTAAAERSDIDVVVQVLRFSDQAEWTTAAPVPVEAFHWTDLPVGGETNMGAAFSRLAASVPPQSPYSNVVVLLSDGLPTDDADSALDAWLDSPHGSRAIRLAVAIGPDADLSLLQEFIGRRDLRPLRASNPEALIRRIRWAASVPLRDIDDGGLGREASAQEEADEDPSAGDMIW